MNVRKLALEAVIKIIDEKAYSNITVNEFLNKYELTVNDKALFTNIVYGTVQNLLTIDFYLKPYIEGKKIKKQIKYLSIVNLRTKGPK